MALAAVVLLPAADNAFADNGTYTGKGGLFAIGTNIGQTISAQAVPLSGLNATASFSCPITANAGGIYQVTWTCAGGSIAIASSDSSVNLTGSFLSGSLALSAAGGGKGGHVTYSYVFSGKFNGTVAASGITEAVVGSISTVLQATAQIGAGGAAVNSLALGWSSAYGPLVVGDAANTRLLGADNLNGANMVAYGNYGAGIGQFNSVAGLAGDATGGIYVTDSTLNRLVRIDDLTGKNWAELGSTGAGNLHFSSPLGVAIDSAGKIWVADAGNNRIVRFDDMTGANWTSFGAAGTGADQFNAPAAIAFDAQGRIYVADAGNNRLVRFDDLNGTNWTALTEILVDPYGYMLTGVNAVAILPNGKIYAATPSGWLYRMDDMTGANGEAAWWQPSIAAISLDEAGTLFVAGGFSPGLAQTLDPFGTGYFSGGLGLTSLQPSAVLAAASITPPPAVPVLSAPSLAFQSRNVDEPGAPQTVSVTNIGGQPLTISSVTASADFLLTNGCSAPLAAGADCTIGVRFSPIAAGARAAALSIESNSVHPLLKVTLSGVGTAPKPSLFPGALAFLSQKVNTASGSEGVEFTNSGTGPLTIASITATGDFTASHNCPGELPARSGCTIKVSFKPSAAGARSGSLIVSDDATAAGSQQSIPLAGVGASSTPALTLNPESLLFPSEQAKVISAAQTLTLRNGSAAVISLGVPVFPAGFGGSTKCAKSLAAGASCVLRVQFAPTAAGSFTGSLVIPVRGRAALTAVLAGTGVVRGPRALAMNPPVVNFGALVIGDNPSQNIGVRNSTGLPVGIRSIVLKGPSAFTVTGNNCPAILAGGASCTVQITFIPTATATYSGRLTVTESSGAATPIALSGSASPDNGN
jgi:sugar lactone lactonase YvrE